MLRLQTSRIPHLAFSISAKRASAQRKSKCVNRQQLLDRSNRYYISLSHANRGQFVRPYVHNHTFSRNASIKRQPPNLPRPRVEPENKPQPTLQDRATAQAVLDEKRAREQRKRIHMSFNTYFWICSLFGFTLSTYIVYTYMAYKGSLKKYEDVELPQNADVSSRWLDMSRNFDDEVELSEKAMFLRSKREKLCREAKGNVLEVSAGTGRNMDLYRLDPLVTPENKRIKSLTFNDFSEIMLYQAQKKFETAQEEIKDKKRLFKGPVQFVVGDAGEPRLIKRPEGGYDTIIQTMGICSETNPVAFLKRMGELCRQPGEISTGLDKNVIAQESQQFRKQFEKSKDYGASEPEEQREMIEAVMAEADGDLGGKILLLEHGRSYLGFLNRVLDNGAKMHADHYGCWWNKDIEQVIKDSGLIVERKRRYHFGTTYEYVLRPQPRSQAAKQELSATDAGGNASVTINSNEGVTAKDRGRGWFGKG